MQDIKLVDSCRGGDLYIFGGEKHHCHLVMCKFQNTHPTDMTTTDNLAQKFFLVMSDNKMCGDQRPLSKTGRN